MDQNLKNVGLLLSSAVVNAGVARAAAAGFAVLSAGRQPTIQVVAAAGTLPGGLAVTTRTLFDLASLSKPVVACVAARLAERGLLLLSAPLGSLLPEAVGTPSEQVPLELLLAHRAGLEANRALFAPLFLGRAFERKRALRDAASCLRPDCRGRPPLAGFAPVYSDMSYILAGAALEAAARKPLDQLVRDEVAGPLGLELGSVRVLRAARPSFSAEVAPTETLLARGGSVRGVVHDENAWAISGHGASGHAGLFGTVEGVLRFAAALLEARAGRSSWLSASAFLPLVRQRPGGTLRAGFDGKSGSDSSAGESSGPDTFGHLGFTGTSVWCDPTAEIATVLLTNRVCPTRHNPRIRAARPEVHDALFRRAQLSGSKS